MLYINQENSTKKDNLCTNIIITEVHKKMPPEIGGI